MSVDNLAARNEVAALFETYAKLFNAEEPAEEAWDAYEAAAEKHGLSIFLTDDKESTILRCAITGVPLVQEDETVLVLASALEKVDAC